MYSFIRINDIAISMLPDTLFRIISDGLKTVFLEKKIENNIALQAFADLTFEYSFADSYIGGEKPKLDIAEIFKDHPDDLKLLIVLLKQISQKIKNEISEPELYALNGTIDKMQSYYQSCMLNE